MLGFCAFTGLPGFDPLHADLLFGTLLARLELPPNRVPARRRLNFDRASLAAGGAAGRRLAQREQAGEEPPS